MFVSSRVWVSVYLCLYVFGMCPAHCISLERLLFLMRRCPFGNNDGDDDHDDDFVLDDDDDDDDSVLDDDDDDISLE